MNIPAMPPPISSAAIPSPAIAHAENDRDDVLPIAAGD